jgi:acylpyruvate hydrolase
MQHYKIQNVWAVGRNYGEHAKELHNPVPATTEDPFIFLKAGSAIAENGASLSFPPSSNEIHYECELAFRFDANLELSELTLALDLTDRELQSKLKEKRYPWSLAKSFKNSCPIGPLVAIPAGTDLQNINFTFRVNGEIRQQGNSENMIFSVEKLREFILERFPVVEGDLLLTGTPAGVGPLRKGDRLEAEIPGLLKAEWHVM